MVTIKPKLISIDLSAWERIRQKIILEYGPTYAISWVVKRELGFTVRTGERWSNRMVVDPLHGHNSRPFVYLDFYNDAQQTYFQLKYL
jgi:hypothetical protein